MKWINIYSRPWQLFLRISCLLLRVLHSRLLPCNLQLFCRGESFLAPLSATTVDLLWSLEWDWMWHIPHLSKSFMWVVWFSLCFCSWQWEWRIPDGGWSFSLDPNRRRFIGLRPATKMPSWLYLYKFIHTQICI